LAYRNSAVAKEACLLGVSNLFRMLSFVYIVLPTLVTFCLLENYVQNQMHDPLRPGALGLGERIATLFSYIFLGWSFIAGILGSIVADCWPGRFQAVIISRG